MHPSLIKLLALNKQRGTFRAEQTAESATVYLYDVIVSDDYWGGVAPLTFIKELLAIDAPVIHLRINSPGGDVFAARAMEQAIREHKSQIIAHIDGYAASAASYLALAADTVEMAPGGFYMIHKAWTVAFGNSKDLTDTAKLLDKIDESLVTTYATETGQDPEQIRQWMADETWFTAEEAVQYGFADSINQGADKSASNSINWDLSAYAKAPNKESRKNEQQSADKYQQNQHNQPESEARNNGLTGDDAAEGSDTSTASPVANAAANRNRLRLATAKAA
ncbi:head maturation protease, ClpP-related [Methylomonas sp. CM2]|uniref:head maturation protease, ClpP-related n=1 Tax=Methylomonas sp. CM2 TaxID=3417647 RepID=UPI003CFAA922